MKLAERAREAGSGKPFSRSAFWPAQICRQTQLSDGVQPGRAAPAQSVVPSAAALAMGARKTRQMRKRRRKERQGMRHSCDELWRFLRGRDDPREAGAILPQD